MMMETSDFSLTAEICEQSCISGPVCYRKKDMAALVLPNAANSYASMPIKHVTYLEVIGADEPTYYSLTVLHGWCLFPQRDS